MSFPRKRESICMDPRVKHEDDRKVVMSLKFLKSLKEKIKDQRGEMATLLTIVSLGLMLVGVAAGTFVARRTGKPLEMFLSEGQGPPSGLCTPGAYYNQCTTTLCPGNEIYVNIPWQCTSGGTWPSGPVNPAGECFPGICPAQSPTTPPAGGRGECEGKDKNHYLGVDTSQGTDGCICDNNNQKYVRMHKDCNCGSGSDHPGISCPRIYPQEDSSCIGVISCSFGGGATPTPGGGGGGGGSGENPPGGCFHLGISLNVEVKDEGGNKVGYFTPTLKIFSDYPQDGHVQVLTADNTNIFGANLCCLFYQSSPYVLTLPVVPVSAGSSVPILYKVKIDECGNLGNLDTISCTLSVSSAGIASATCPLSGGGGGGTTPGPGTPSPTQPSGANCTLNPPLQNPAVEPLACVQCLIKHCRDHYYSIGHTQCTDQQIVNNWCNGGVLGGQEDCRQKRTNDNPTIGVCKSACGGGPVTGCNRLDDCMNISEQPVSEKDGKYYASQTCQLPEYKTRDEACNSYYPPASEQCSVVYYCDTNSTTTGNNPVSKHFTTGRFYASLNNCTGTFYDTIDEACNSYYPPAECTLLPDCDTQIITETGKYPVSQKGNKFYAGKNCNVAKYYPFWESACDSYFSSEIPSEIPPDSDPCSVFKLIVSSSTGEKISGAIVNIKSDKLDSYSITNSEGVAETTNIDAGFYTISVKADGYQSFTDTEVLIMAPTNCEYDMGLIPTGGYCYPRTCLILSKRAFTKDDKIYYRNITDCVGDKSTKSFGSLQEACDIDGGSDDLGPFAVIPVTLKGFLEAYDMYRANPNDTMSQYYSNWLVLVKESGSPVTGLQIQFITIENPLVPGPSYPPGII